MLLLSKKNRLGRVGYVRGQKNDFIDIRSGLETSSSVGVTKGCGGVKTSISICTWPRHPLESLSKSRHQMRSHFVKLSPVAPAKF